jgi:lysophospholipase L1-like esterase
MDITKFYKREGEKPLDNMVTNGGLCGIFRTVACIGDSLSSGELESMMNGQPGWHDYYEYSWGQYIARDAGCTVYNFSRGGMNAEWYCKEFAAQKGFYDESLKAQAYIIALGVNDTTEVMNGNIELGSLADIDAENPENNKPTVIGYYAKIISDYKRIQPKAKFFLMTMPKEYNVEGRRLELYEELSDMIRELPNIFDNCYILDMRKYSPEHDEEFKRNFWLAGHLNASGYRIFALMVESYIDYVIRNYPDDFTQAGFIGTEFYNENSKW